MNLKQVRAKLYLTLENCVDSFTPTFSWKSNGSSSHLYSRTIFALVMKCDSLLSILRKNFSGKARIFVNLVRSEMQKKYCSSTFNFCWIQMHIVSVYRVIQKRDKKSNEVWYNYTIMKQQISFISSVDEANAFIKQNQFD